MLLVNFKTYENAVGKSALVLAELHARLAKNSPTPIGIAVNPLDLASVCQAYPNLPVFLQHSDEFGFGSHTGSINPTLAKALGATGVLLNHSEKRLGPRLPDCVTAAQAAGLQVIVCAENATEAAELSQSFKQLAFIAVEPRELIGGATSVTTANPAIIRESVNSIAPSKLLVGAGIKKQADVKTALKLGASGVLLASGVICAEDPEAVLGDLLQGFDS